MARSGLTLQKALLPAPISEETDRSQWHHVPPPAPAIPRHPVLFPHPSPPMVGFLCGRGRCLLQSRGPPLFLTASQLPRILPCPPPLVPATSCLWGAPPLPAHTVIVAESIFRVAGREAFSSWGTRKVTPFAARGPTGREGGLLPTGALPAWPTVRHAIESHPGESPRCSRVWGHHSTLPSSRGPVRHPASLRETTNVRPFKAGMGRHRTKRA